MSPDGSFLSLPEEGQGHGGPALSGVEFGRGVEVDTLKAEGDFIETEGIAA